MKVKYAHLGETKDSSVACGLHRGQHRPLHLMPELCHSLLESGFKPCKWRVFKGREEVGWHLRKPTGGFSSIAEPWTPHDLKNNSNAQRHGHWMPICSLGAAVKPAVWTAGWWTAPFTSQLLAQGSGRRPWNSKPQVRFCTMASPMRQTELMGDLHPCCSISGIR